MVEKEQKESSITIIPLIGEIKDETFEEFFANFITAEYSEGEEIHIYLNSYGGDLHHTMAIYDLIRDSQKYIVVNCGGYCMSGGSVILQAADYRRLYQHTTMMLHFGTRAFRGNPDEFYNWANYFKENKETLISCYTEQMKGNKKQNYKIINEMLSTDTILTAKDAVGLGLADEIIS